MKFLQSQQFNHIELFIVSLLFKYPIYSNISIFIPMFVPPLLFFLVFLVNFCIFSWNQILT